MINIRKIDGTVRLSIDLTKESSYKFELMKEEYILLSFSLDGFIVFETGDYVDFAESGDPILHSFGKRFELVEKEYKPEYNPNTAGYDYKLRLDADYWKWKNKIFKYQPDFSGLEASWSLTATPDVFLDKVKENLNNLGYDYRGVSYQSAISEEFSGKNIALTFDAKSIIDALTDICTALDPDGKTCEWWIEEGIIFIGRCYDQYRTGADKINLTFGENAETVTTNNAQNKFANRLFAFGSTNNISKRYGKDIILTPNEVSGNMFMDDQRKLTYDYFDNPTYPTQSHIDFLSTNTVSFDWQGGQQSFGGYVQDQDEYTVVSGTEYLLGNAVTTNEQTRTIYSHTQTGGWSKVKLGRFYVDLNNGLGFANYGTVRLTAEILADENVVKSVPREITLPNNVVDFGEITLDDIIDHSKPTTFSVRVKIQLANFRPWWRLTYSWNNPMLGNYGCNYEVVTVNVSVSSQSNVEVYKRVYPHVETTLSILNNDNEIIGWIRAKLNADHLYSGDENSALFTKLSGEMFDGTTVPALNNLRLGVFYNDDNGKRKYDIVKGRVPVEYFSYVFRNEIPASFEQRLMLPTEPVYKKTDGTLTFDHETDGHENTLVYDGRGYLESESGLPEEKYFEDMVVFEDAYPHFVGVMENVTEIDRWENEDDKNSKFIAFQFTNDSIKNFSTKYISGDKLNITFSAVKKGGIDYNGGKLNGLTFELKFIGNDGYKSEDIVYNPSVYTIFEINRNKNYQAPLPDKDTDMIPENNDGYYITGLDVSVYDEGGKLVEEAELELVRLALLYMKYKGLEVKTKNCRLMADYAKNQLENNKFFHLGDDVTLYTDNEEVFKSRIIGGEFRLDIPWDNPTIIIGESSQFSSIGALKESIEGVSFSRVSSVAGGSGSSLSVIKSTDKRVESDLTVYSALRAKQENDKLLRKDTDDKTDFTLGAKNLNVEQTINSKTVNSQNANSQNLKSENAEIENARVKDLTIGLENEEVDEKPRFHTSSFRDSMNKGFGAFLTNKGRLQVQNLEVRGALHVMSLVYDQIQAMAGDYYFTEIGRIKKVEHDTSDLTYPHRYKVFLEHSYPTEVVPIWEGDILYSIASNILVNSKGSEAYGVFPSWMKVLSVVQTSLDDNWLEAHGYESISDVPQDEIEKNEQGFYVTVDLYSDNDFVVEETNFPPEEGFNVVRRGNYLAQGDNTKKERARLWHISNSEGMISFMDYLYSPKVLDANYQTTIGKLPNVKVLREWFNDFYNHDLPSDHVGVYTQFLFAENFVKIDWQGRVMTQQNPRGEWSLEVAQSESPYRNRTFEQTIGGKKVVTVWQADTVTYLGCVWQCATDGTTNPPSWRQTDWILLEGNTNYTIEFASSKGYSFRRGYVDTVVTPHLFWGNIDITDEVAAEYWNWTRTEENPTQEDIERDAAWNRKHEGMKIFHLTNEDMPPTWSSRNKVIFTCTVSVNDGKSTIIVDNQIIS